jgi:hypothetical protein
MKKYNYVTELNRMRGNSIRRAEAHLKRLGLAVRRLPHLTALHIKRPKWMSWAQFKAAIRSVLQPRRGSAVVFSWTGRVYVCSYRGNQPGVFQPVA